MRYPYPPGKLTILVGPSGAGKSTHVKTYTFQDGIDVRGWRDSEVISTDAIRVELCGHLEDQSKNQQVFFALHKLVKARIESGLDVVVDATNLRHADRRALRELVPDDTHIEYHIINRSIEEKLKTGGWRLKIENNGVGLIERHDQIFNSNLKDIMNGDGDPRVKVLDFREDK